MPEELERYYNAIVPAILEGDVVFFLGAGANLCGRPQGTAWEKGKYLPSGNELALSLAKSFGYPYAAESGDLMRVSQFATLSRGIGPLKKELRKAFDADYPPTDLHKFLARLPARLRSTQREGNLLILTTNYDDLLERAFAEEKEQYDLLTYLANEESTQGKFQHTPFGEEPRVVDVPNEYTAVSLKTRSVIVKIHGAVRRGDASLAADSYVISEDDYLDYLTRADAHKLVPTLILAALKNTGFLFLGYSLRDWNMRVLLRQIWRGKSAYKSWAVQNQVDLVDDMSWQQRQVDILEVSLEQFVARLGERVDEALSVAAA